LTPRRILLAGAATGVTDILWAFALSYAIVGQWPVQRVLQGVAGGLLGRETARGGGLPTALLGLLLHFTIATIWASVYFLALRAGPGLRRLASTLGGRVLLGAIFGMLVWVLMAAVVVPHFSRLPGPVLGSKSFWIQLAGHIPFVGMPIALILRPSA
jgi:cytosine/uracil/thiamine/allantoin permease